MCTNVYACFCLFLHDVVNCFCCICHNRIHVISLKRESGRLSFHIREVFQKCIEYIGELLIQIGEIS